MRLKFIKLNNNKLYPDTFDGIWLGFDAGVLGFHWGLKKKEVRDEGCNGGGRRRRGEWPEREKGASRVFSED